MPVLQDVTLQIYPAEVVALVGSNGAGKTTLLRALSRMLPCRGSMAMNSQGSLADDVRPGLCGRPRPGS